MYGKNILKSKPIYSDNIRTINIKKINNNSPKYFLKISNNIYTINIFYIHI